MDGVGKRRIVLSAIIIIQAVKISDLIHMLDSGTSGSSLIAKWSVLEAIGLLLLWSLRIPRLNFGFKTSLAIEILLLISNLFIFGGLPLLIRHAMFILHLRPSTLKLSPHSGSPGFGLEDIDDIAGSKEQLIQDLQEENHLKGSYTIKLQPWSSVHIDAGRLNLCVPASSPMPNSNSLPESIRRPILANAIKPIISLSLSAYGVGPWSVTVTRNKIFYLEATISTLGRGSIEVSQPGTYEITRAIDGNGKEAALEEPRVIVIESCPEFRFDGLIVEKIIESCPTKLLPLTFWIKSGTPPYSAVLEYTMGKLVKKLYLDNIIPSGPTVDSFKAYKFEADLTKLFPDRSYPKDFLLRVGSITDGSDFSHNYGEWDIGDAISIQVFDSPFASWTRSKLFISRHSTRIKLPLKTSGRLPLELEFRSPKGVSFISTAHSHDEVYLDSPIAGPYKLLRVKNELCNGNIAAEDILDLSIVQEPHVEISSVPIYGSCEGHVVGLFLDLTFTGEAPPWNLQFEETWSPHKDQNVSSRPITTKFDIKSSAPFHRYVWKPQRPGIYIIKAVALCDQIYDRGAVYQQTIRQLILPTPNAYFSQPESSSVEIPSGCRRQELGFAFPVTLTGVLPITLDYNVTSSSGTESFTINSTAEEVYLRLKPYEEAGEFFIQLAAIQDSTGCKSEVTHQLRKFKIYEKAPYAMFPTKDVKLRAGMNDLVPIQLHANSMPADLVLHFTPKDSTKVVEHSYKIKSLELRSIRFPEVNGTWEIIKVQDQYCSSSDLNQMAANCQVKVIQPPKASLVESTPTIIARNVYKPPQVILYGTSPVVLAYTLSFGLTEEIARTKKGETKTIKGSTGATYPLLQGTNSIPPIPGFYRFELASVSDDLFPAMKATGEVIQHLLPDPVPRLELVSPTNTFCFEANSTDIGPIRIDFLGSEAHETFPLEVHVAVEKANSRSSFILRVDENRTFTIPSVNVSPGIHRIRVVRLHTAIGGVWQAPDLDFSSKALEQVQNGLSFFINFVQRPYFTVKQHDMMHYCVGDVVHFRFFGSGPYTFSYSHANGKIRHEKTSVDGINILLAEPGEFKVLALCNDYCCSKHNELEEGLEKSSGSQIDAFKVFPLPSAQIHSGMSLMRAGESAEIAVTLKGVPPFNYTIGRLDETGKVTETNSYRCLNFIDPTINLSKNGTYKVIHVQDSHCDYPRRAFRD